MRHKPYTKKSHELQTVARNQGILVQVFLYGADGALPCNSWDRSEGTRYGLSDDAGMHEALACSVLGIGVGTYHWGGEVPHRFLQAWRG